MLLGLVVGASTAQAQVYTFDAPFSTILGVPVAGASGSYHVVVTGLGALMYKVEINGNVDGNPPSGPENTANPPGNPIPKSGAGIISINFQKQGGGDIASVAAGPASTTAYVGPVDGNLGGPNNTRFGATGGAWASFAGATTLYLAGTNPLYIAPHGGNLFTGFLTLATDDVAGIGVSLQDSGQQWHGDFAVTPEASSFALLLPGLIPVGIALRRRRKSTKA